jgi:hypothetical protein
VAVSIAERVKWIVVPAGTAERRRRVSVVVQPKIEAASEAEGAGLTLKDLKRFTDWPRFLATLDLVLHVETPAGHHRVRLLPPKPDPALWSIFPPDLPVRPVVAGDPPPERTLYVLAPPTELLCHLAQSTYLQGLARALDVTKEHERDRLARLAKLLASEATWPPKSWDDHLKAYGEVQPGSTPSEGLILHPELSDKTLDSAFAAALSQLRLFHSRPPLDLFPLLLQRPLQVSQKGKHVKRDLDGLTPVRKEDIGKEFGPPEQCPPPPHPCGYLLPRLREVPPPTPGQAPPPAGPKVPLSFDFTNPAGGAAPYSVQTQPGEHLGSGGEGIEVRPGDRVEIREDQGLWVVARQAVAVGPDQDGSILYGDPMRRSDGGVQELVFVLPRRGDLPNGFQVTLRNASAPASSATEIAASCWVMCDDWAPGVSAPIAVKAPPDSPFPPIVLPGSQGIELGPGDSRVIRKTPDGLAPEAENVQDLHEVLASLRSFPAVLRRLGVVLDIDVPGEDDQHQPITLGGIGALRLEVRVHSNPSTEDPLSSCPWSAYEVFEDGFFLPRPRTVAPGTRDAQLANYRKGLLAALGGPGRYSLVQLDADAAGLKLAAEALRGEIDTQQPRPKAVADLPRGEQLQDPGLPALRAIGFSLCDAWLEADVHGARQRGAAVRAGTDVSTDSSAGAELLFAEDLVQGYRVDVRREDGAAPRLWRSLCLREGTYRFHLRGGTDPPPWTCCDEGFLSQAVDHVADPKGKQVADPKEGARMARSLFRWDGWSLVAERPGSPIRNEGRGLKTSGEKVPPTGRPVVARFKPQPGSLERARFGSRYAFRLRHVDLAGNSLTTDEATAASRSVDTELVVFRSTPLSRMEPVPPPHLLPRQEPGDGEANDQLVLRSFDGRDTDAKEWYLVPPQVTAELAELHGVFDAMRPEDSYRVLCDYDDELPKWEFSPNCPPSRGYSAEWLARHEGPHGLRVPYLPDPMACGAVFAVMGCAGILARLSFGSPAPSEHYPHRVQVPRITLAPGSARVTSSEHRLELFLPTGRAAVLELSSTLCDDDVAKLGLLHWADVGLDSETAEIRATTTVDTSLRRATHNAALAQTRDGAIPLITPRRRVTLVHAVQRPLIPKGLCEIQFNCDRRYRFDNPFKVELTLGSTSASVEGQIHIDVPSTGKLDLQAEWREPVDDPSLPDWSQADRNANAFEMKVEALAGQLVTFGAAPCPTAGTQAPCVDLSLFVFQGIQKFQDTRHRVVTYRAVATSRYVEFFPAAMRQGVAADEAIKLEQTKDLIRKNFTRVSAPCTFHVPATAPPAPPQPYYIVPTFAFEEHRERHRVTAVRKGRGLRIYLKRGWFSSGDGEMLAVVLAQQQWSELPDPLGQFVTEWGLDPIWGKDGVTLPRHPGLENFPTAAERVGGLLTTVLLPPDQPGGQPVKAEIEIAVAAYPVALDRDKDLLYADVEIAGFDAYYPFIRLGLARYQKFALTSCELSPIVRAEFVQVTPDRVATVTRRSHDCVDIVVTGADPMMERHCPDLYTKLSWDVHLEHFEAGFILDQSKPLATLVWAPGKPGEAIWTGTVKLPGGCRRRKLWLVERWSGLVASDADPVKVEAHRSEVIAAVVPLQT